ncbi:MAG: hypothetical protein QOH34_1999 [Mycobacterium sp.]|jgi:hypothetical protein|nr:hypothetical protein [Mycobacterium sp.]
MRSLCAGGGLTTRTAAANTAITASQHLEIALTRRPGFDLPVRSWKGSRSAKPLRDEPTQPLYSSSQEGAER